MNGHTPFRLARLVPILLLVFSPVLSGPATVTAAARVPLRGPAQAPAGAAPLSPSGPQACGGVYTPIADAATNQASPTTNYGADTLLPLYAAGVQQDWLDFAVTSHLPLSATIYSAELHLTVFKVGGPAPQQFKLANAQAAWTEGAITWNNQPALGPVAASFSRTLAINDVITMDVTTLVTQWNTGALAEHGFALTPVSAGLDVEFYSKENGNAALNPQLVVKCGYNNPVLPSDQTARDAAQQADINRLKQNSTTPVTLVLEHGALRFANFTLPVPSQFQNDPLAAAQWFLNDYHALLRLDNTAQQLQLSGRSRDGFNLTFRRVEHGIPVFPADLTVHTGGANITGLNGRYATEVGLDPTPRLPAFSAEALALAGAHPGARLDGDTQQRYIDMGLLGLGDGLLHAGWAVHLTDSAGARTLYLDGNSGALLYSDWQEFTDFDLDLRHAHNGGPDTIWCYNFNFGNEDNTVYDEHGAVIGSPDAASTSAFFSMQAVDNFWRATLGRDSMNGHGGQVKLYLHVGPTIASGMNWLNAHFTAWCNQLEFGENISTRDVIAHEYTHGVIENSGGLIYQTQSGALNESFADIFGHFVDSSNWTIGEGTQLGVIRNLSNPPALGDPDHVLSSTSGDGTGLRVLAPGVGPDCDGSSPTYNDCGFVHTNSGIHNKAGFLVIQGQNFNGFNVQGIGLTKAAHLFYGVLNNRRLSSSAQFIDARNAAVAQAQAYAATGAFGFSNLNVCSVRNAYAAVGLGSGDHDCDGIEDVVDPDVDGDAVPNGLDNCPIVSNPGQSDQDHDGLGDACDPDRDGDGVPNESDNCPLVANPGQEDSNMNGIGNACDDSDHDGVPDPADNCPLATNRDQRDEDFDGLGDVCDNDRDGDGVLNGFDNSPDVYNPGQADSDFDGIGDASDLCPGLSSSDNGDLDHDGIGNPCDPDADGDGVANGSDNCPLTANRDQWDSDGNGVGLACDAAEQQSFLDQARQVGANLRFLGDIPLDLPLPVCPACGAGYLPNNFLETISVELPAGFSAMVVDSSGAAVARSVDAGHLQHLTFEPAPYGALGVLLAGEQPSLTAAGLPLGPPPPDGVRYHLKLFPANSGQVGQTIPFTITVGSHIDGALYLPLIYR